MGDEGRMLQDEDGGMVQVVQVIKEMEIKEKVDEFAGEGIVMQIKRTSGWRKKNLRICQLNIGLSRCKETMLKVMMPIMSINLRNCKFLQELKLH